MDALVLKNLRKVYKNGVEALKGIDLVVREGDFFALLGPNGAGKTTLIGIITSLVRKSGGSRERVRLRHRARARGGESLHRRRAAGDQLQHVRAKRQHPRQPGRLLRRAARRRAGTRREIPRGPAAVGQALRRRAHAVGRHEATADDRARADARAAAADPRRADGRRRHRDPPLDVGLHARDQRGGRHDHPDHALSRGGREPVPQHRDHRRGQDHRERQHEERDRQAAARVVRAEPSASRSQQPPLLDGYRGARCATSTTIEVECREGPRPEPRVRRRCRRSRLHVPSMRTKTNRLEELFMRLVEDKDQQAGVGR